MQQTRTIAIFTDLDGTLLDHDDYRWDAARPAIERIRSLSIPLIAVSSKTLAELDHIQMNYGLFDGLIGENGGVISLDGEVEQPGPSSQTIDSARDAIIAAVNVPLGSFRTVPPEMIATETGLTLDDAIRAGQRHCSDPLIWQPSEQDIEIATDIASQFSLKLVKGGRFHTLCGPSNKGAAMKRMLERLVVSGRLGDGDGNGDGDTNTAITTIALGDSANDIPMLAAADIAVQIPPKRGIRSEPLLTHSDLRIAPYPGPEGWNAALQSILDQIINTNKKSEVLHG
ncbi:MAG: mannosyl-3-phosphoglycerate phosphatase [Thalassospira sp.]|uniref:HAD-IIB family hydrolase n=1 Tax=Thalassospira sp. GB04J01 TaxID=1485225 RepID=UPI000C0F48FF|nr:HAD hydrolase family protein [Thalassospira sp. GB04J01]MBV17749.1 mannosyl-3-phosphoglycerate phosphatase [Thalassospira sp.]|tara:strand:- start:50011 stop:50865 length:855 start_codon:yes stop_codon:yes gene_type:complete